MNQISKETIVAVLNYRYGLVDGDLHTWADCSTQFGLSIPAMVLGERALITETKEEQS